VSELDAGVDSGDGLEDTQPRRAPFGGPFADFFHPDAGTAKVEKLKFYIMPLDIVKCVKLTASNSFVTSLQH
jgi:hypothetical protein